MAIEPAALLRERGIQVTAQRLAVLRAVSAQPHITADAVAEIARTEIGAISLQSVYDALALLVAEGLVRRIQPSGSPARFEDRVGDNHHHLICRTCGRVVDVDCTVGAAPCLTPHGGGGYEIDEAEVAFWGRCPSCLAQARLTTPDARPAVATAGSQVPARTRRQSSPSTDRSRSASRSRSNSRRTRRSS